MDARPTERFTSRVDNYVRYRPDYPAGIIALLSEEIGLEPGWSLADIGSGPGNLTRLFLNAGFDVTGVEPNDAMRESGEILMAEYSHFTSVDGSAESTGLPEASFDLITAGQAFHWFDPEAARVEFQRILKSPGSVALIWNKRPDGSSQMLDEYSEMLMRHSTEYDVVRRRDDRAEAGMDVLFGPAGYRAFSLPHEQLLDFDAFWGRLLSSSYTPLPGEPGHDEIHQGTQEIFAAHAVDGVLRFPYETQIFIGQVSPAGK